eukprot:gene17865-24256_t
MSRAMRRRPDRYRSQLLQTLSASLAPDSGLGPRRKLETHVWSAQRMKMEESSLHPVQLPSPRTAPFTLYSSLHPVQLPSPSTAPFTQDSSLHPVQLPPPSTAPFTQYSSLHPVQLPPPSTAPSTQYSSLHPVQLPSPSTAPFTQYSSLHPAYGRGHGSRSFLHTVKDSGCVMHDASYWTCIQLQGSQRQITAALRHVRERVCSGADERPNSGRRAATPAPSANSAEGGGVQEGAAGTGMKSTTAVLDSYTPKEESMVSQIQALLKVLTSSRPAGSTASRSLPVGHDSQFTASWVTASQFTARLESTPDGSLPRWVHCSQFTTPKLGTPAGSRPFGVFTAAGERPAGSPPAGSLPAGSLPAISLPAGSTQPVHCRAPCCVSRSITASQFTASWVTASQFTASWVTASHSPSELGALMRQSEVFCGAVEFDLNLHAVGAYPARDWTDGARDLLLTASPSSASYKPSAEGPPPLTGSSVAPPNRAGCPPPLTGCAPPLSTQVLGELRQKEKHEQLLQHGSFRKPAEASTSRMDIDSVPGVGLASGGTPASGTTFPVLLVRRRMSDNVSGWSIIVPHGWVMPVWIGLAMCGVRAAGQTEWHWLSSHCGRPFFPLDHPHTPAGAAMANFQRGQHLKESALRPMGRVRKLPAGPYVPWELSCNPLPQPPTSTAPSRPAASNKATWGRWLTMPTGMPKKVGGMSVGKATAVGDKVGDTVGGTSVGKGAAVGCKGGETDRLGGGDLAGASGNAQQFPPTSSGLTGSGATGSGGNIAPPSPEQHAAQPPLCVVRSHRQAALALDMKIMSPSTEQDQNPQQRRLRGPRGPRTKPPNFCPQRAVDKALAHKLVQWVPCRPPAMRARHVFVFVRLRIQGKGRCEEGAVIATPKDSWTQTVDSTFSQGTASGGPVPLASVSAGTVLSTSVSAGTVPRTSVSAGIVPRTSVSDAMGGSVLLQAKVLCSDAGFTGAGCEISEFNTLGYVTSAVPRGGDNYPAGLGLCNFDLLWALRSKHYVTGQRTDQRDIQVMVLNPGSNALRKAVLTICFEEEVVA